MSVKRLGLIWCCVWSCVLLAAETLPPRPEKFFNDYASVVPAGKGRELNERLAAFERETSSQIVVAVFPKLTTDSSLEDFTVRTAKAWQVGQKDKRNGAILFVFVQDRKLRIEVGYGVEGALPDAICKRIISDTIAPHLRKGDYAGGLAAGVNAMIAATKGEYKGTGRTRAESADQSAPFIAIGIFGFFFLLFLIAMTRATRGTVYSRGGYRRRDSGWNWNWGNSSSSGGSWGGSSWGGGSSGSSSFSGGGGDFGGGGASGSW